MYTQLPYFKLAADDFDFVTLHIYEHLSINRLLANYSTKYNTLASLEILADGATFDNGICTVLFDCYSERAARFVQEFVYTANIYSSAEIHIASTEVEQESGIALELTDDSAGRIADDIARYESLAWVDTSTAGSFETSGFAVKPYSSSYLRPHASKKSYKKFVLLSTCTGVVTEMLAFIAMSGLVVAAVEQSLRSTPYASTCIEWGFERSNTGELHMQATFVSGKSTPLSVIKKEVMSVITNLNTAKNLETLQRSIQAYLSRPDFAERGTLELLRTLSIFVAPADMTIWQTQNIAGALVGFVGNTEVNLI
jgi:hypothetical protein